MDFDAQKKELDVIYARYEREVALYKAGAICKPGCAFCCTHFGNVDVTTLEGRIIHAWVNQQHPETLDRMRAKTISTSAYGYVNIRQALQNRQPVTDRLSAIKVPTLIIYADDDLPFCISGSQMMHQRIAGSELAMIANSGHGSMYEQSAAFNRLLSAFLKRIEW